MGRQRKFVVTAVRFTAHRDKQSEVFTSRKLALAFIATAKHTPRLEETYFTCRGWQLHVEAVPRRGEDPSDAESHTGYVLTEKPFILKGADSTELLARAEAQRLQSFARHWLLFTRQENLDQLAPESRKLALQTIDLEYVKFDEGDRRLVEKKKANEKKAWEAAVPTVGAAFETELSRRVKQGSVRSNTAEVYRYEASAFEIEVSHGKSMVAFKDVQVHRLTEKMVRDWFDAYSLTETRFKKLPSTKTCINVLGRLQIVKDGLKRQPEYRGFIEHFAAIDEMLEDLREGSRDTDGWRKRRRFSNEDIGKLIASCTTDLERAALALMLAGSRPPSEPTAVAWHHLEYDDAENLWWHVSASAIQLVGGKLELRVGQTKTGDADFRQLNVCKGLAKWIERRRGKSHWVLGDGDKPMLPSELDKLFDGIVERAGVAGKSLSIYSLRHTVSDEVERVLGPTIRDRVLHGRRERTTGNLHYSHALRDRRRAEVTVDGKPYGDHMVWATHRALT